MATFTLSEVSGQTTFRVYVLPAQDYMLVGRVLATAASSSYTIREVNTTGQVVNSSEITIADTTGYHEISNAYTTSGAAIMLIISFIGADVLELWIDGPAGVSTISQPVEQYLAYYSQYDAIISYLDLAYAVKFSHKVNSLSTLTFSLPFDDDKTAELVTENYVKYNTQKYIIKKISKSRKENALMVECEHIGGGLIDYWIDGLTELTNVTATTALTQALAGTDYTVGTVEVTGGKDISFENMTALEAVKKTQETWGAELDLDNKEVSLLVQQGEDNGIQFRRGKNLQAILKEENTNNLVTKLYGYGKDNLTIVGMDTTSWTDEEKTGLTIDPVTHLITQTYIESQYIDSYAKEYQGALTDSSIEVEEDLLAAMRTTLTAREVPKVRYEADVVDLSSLAAYYGEGFEIGDTCKVIDEDYNIDISARILELEEHPFEPWQDKVIVGNFQENIHDLIAGLTDTQKTVEKVLSGGKVNTYWLTGYINALQNQIKASGAYATAEVLEDQGFLLENTNPVSPDYGALYLGPGIFAIADDKAGDEWNWRTFGTGAGFTADVINAGTLNTNLIKIMGTDENFFWDETGLWCIDGDDVVKITSAGVAIGTAGVEGALPSFLTGKGLKVTHIDGSYTQLTVDGLERVITGEGNKPYMYETYVVASTTKGSGTEGWIDTSDPDYETVYNAWQDGVTVTLPAHFQDKDFTCYVNYRAGNMPMRDGSIGESFLEILSINYATGEVQVRGYNFNTNFSLHGFAGMDFNLIATM
jgi:phage minor structural protein